MISRQSNHTRKKTRNPHRGPSGLANPFRVAERMEDLDDEALKDIAAAEVPAQFAYLDKLDLDQY